MIDTSSLLTRLFRKSSTVLNIGSVPFIQVCLDFLIMTCYTSDTFIIHHTYNALDKGMIPDYFHNKFNIINLRYDKDLLLKVDPVRGPRRFKGCVCTFCVDKCGYYDGRKIKSQSRSSSLCFPFTSQRSLCNLSDSYFDLMKNARAQRSEQTFSYQISRKDNILNYLPKRDFQFYSLFFPLFMKVFDGRQVYPYREMLELRRQNTSHLFFRMRISNVETQQDRMYEKLMRTPLVMKISSNQFVREFRDTDNYEDYHDNHSL